MNKLVIEAERVANTNMAYCRNDQSVLCYGAVDRFLLKLPNKVALEVRDEPFEGGQEVFILNVGGGALLWATDDETEPCHDFHLQFEELFMDTFNLVQGPVVKFYYKITNLDK